MLGNAIAVINAKGGVGKTSLVAQIGGLAALAGWRCLMIDLDAQGNLARDLGVMDRSDRGEGLARSVAEVRTPTPIEEVRENIDYIPGGDLIRQAYRIFESNHDGMPGYLLFDRSIGPLAERYDLILLDCPPGEEMAQMAALVSARFLLCPVRSDLGSIDGLSGVLKRAVNVRSLYNPGLEILGVVIMMVGKSSKRILRETAAEIEHRSGSRLKVFNTSIRSAESVATHCRRSGLLVHELETQAKALNQSRLQRLRKRSDSSPLPASMPDGRGLAEDYQSLTTEILSMVRSRLDGEPNE